MEVLIQLLEFLDEDSLKTLLVTSKNLELPVLRQLTLNKWKNLYLGFNKDLDEKSWYRLLLKYRPSSKGVREAVLDKQFVILNLLEQIGILPNVYSANMAAGNNLIDVLIWLEQRGILPDVNGADWAYRYENYDVLEWLEQRGIVVEY